MDYPRAEFVRLGKSSELTVLSPIKRGLIPGEIRSYEERLRAVLDSLKRRALAGVPTPISQVPTIHFARWVILRPEQYLQYSSIEDIDYYDDGDPGISGNPEGQDGNRGMLPRSVPMPYSPDYISAVHTGGRTPILPSWLLFTSNYDGDLKAYIRAFSTDIASDIDRVWGNCEYYPGGGAADFERFWAYIRRHQIDTAAFFSAYPTLSTPRICQLDVFRRKFDAFVASTRNAQGNSIEAIGPLFDEFIRLHAAYTSDFPGEGGLYDEEQADRQAEIKTCPR